MSAELLTGKLGFFPCQLRVFRIWAGKDLVIVAVAFPQDGVLRQIYRRLVLLERIYLECLYLQCAVVMRRLVSVSGGRPGR